MKIVQITLFLFGIGFLNSLGAQDWEAFAALYGEEPMTDTIEMSEDDSLEIAEMTFRNLFANNKAVKPRKSKYYIISFLHCARHMFLDPDGIFMSQLQDIRPKVRKTSFYYKREKKLYGKVMFFFITDMAMVDAKTAKVRGGYYQSEDACAGHLYTFKKVDGYWDIDRVVVEWQL